MDITSLFKACVKTIRTRNKAFGLVGDSDRSRIFPQRPQKNDFTIRAKEVVAQITRLRDFLLEHRKAYLNFASHLPDTPQMTDLERDKIDSGAQRIMNTCSHLIQNFKRESVNIDGSPQLLEHRQAVLDLVECYLKSVCKIYSEQRAIRVKRSLEIQKISKLGDIDPLKSYSNDTGRLKNRKEPSLGSEIIETTVEFDKDSSTKNKSSVPAYDQSLISEDDQLTAEELQMFELENAQLYIELNNLTEEVRQIESKVVRIAELQEIFTEKVLQQDKDIDRIVTTVVGATENVKDANDQIRQAIQRNAGLRVYILFFLLVMSFSLLFLDWYND
ncbi:Syntaxin-18 [Gryllus bimaculatus]|nr:Syntaxin-18 [Gryllus bimaculatus]